MINRDSIKRSEMMPEPRFAAEHGRPQDMSPMESAAHISMDKKYTTRDGREVRIYALDGIGVYPVHGAVKVDDGWSVSTWASSGATYSSEVGVSQGDLIEKIKTTEVPEFWHVLSADGSWDLLKNDPSGKGFKSIIHYPARTIPASEAK